MIVSRAVIAIARRQLGAFLGSPLGYIFILAFVVIAAAVNFVPDDFYRRNIADFGALYQWMPWLLAALLPALAMSAWSSEREHGTEELLLTLPVTVSEAVLGKYLAVVVFYTIAVLCSLSNVAMLCLLGDPDWGQLLANLIAWWLLGTGFAALGLLGSVLASSAAIAFAIGVLLCAVFGVIVSGADLVVSYDRGLVGLDLLLACVAAVVGALGAAVFVLGSRRWHPQRRDVVRNQVVSVVLAVIVAINFGRWAARSDWATDFSVAGVSSLSAEGERIVTELPFALELTVVVSDDEVLPRSLASKAQEVLAKARAIEVAADGLVHLTVLRPSDPFDEAGTQASDHHGLRPRPSIAETVVGNEEVDVFLGATVTCGSRSQRIDYFEPGLAVEYELVRALGTVAAQAAAPASVTVRVVVAGEPEAELAAAARAWAAGEHGDGISVELIERDDPAAAAAEFSLAAHEAAEDTAAALCGALIDGPFPARVASFTDAGALPGELRAAIARARRPLPVLGVVGGALEMSGGFDMRTYQQRPAWGVVAEWGKQYTVTSVTAESLDPDDDGIDALVVALPSGLSPAGLAQVSAWIHRGRPTLLLCDPLPMFPMSQGQMVAPAAPAQSSQPSMPGMPPPQPEPKAGIEGVEPLLAALGVDIELDWALWSSYTPSYNFASLPRELVWFERARGGFSDDPALAGIDSLLLPAPGMIRVRGDATTTVMPLISLGGSEPWGVQPYEGYLQRGMFGQPSLRLPQPANSYRASSAPERPMVAARIMGPLLATDGSVAGEARVLLVADSDFLHDGMVNLYRQVPTGPDSDAPPELARLRNVQFAENLIGELFGGDSLRDLRGHRPGRRSLLALDAQRSAHRQAVVQRQMDAREDAEDAKAALETELQVKVDTLMARTDIDAQRKANEAAFMQEQAQRRNMRRILAIDQDLEKQVRQANAEYRAAVARDRFVVKARVVAIPTLVLLLLVILVTVLRLMGERSDIPQARARRKA
ncbi:MAG: Gldg family protein [Planctomycetota bacterium]|jgi:hypothetical protein